MDKKARQAMTQMPRHNLSYSKENWFNTKVYGQEEYSTAKAESPNAASLEEELGGVELRARLIVDLGERIARVDLLADMRE